VVTYRTFTIIIGVLISMILLLLVRRSRLHSALFIWWSAMIALMLIFAFFPGLIDTVGQTFGVAYPPVIISVAGLGLVFVKILTMDIYITKNEVRYNKLAQKMAILELMLKEMEKENGNDT